VRRRVVHSIIMQVFGIVLAISQPTFANGPSRQLAGKRGFVFAINGESKLGVFTAGNGPTVVMLPARGLGPFELEPVAERLVAAGFRVTQTSLERLS
jgi:hypothetical protein